MVACATTARKEPRAFYTQSQAQRSATRAKQDNFKMPKASSNANSAKWAVSSTSNVKRIARPALQASLAVKWVPNTARHAERGNLATQTAVQRAICAQLDSLQTKRHKHCVRCARLGGTKAARARPHVTVNCAQWANLRHRVKPQQYNAQHVQLGVTKTQRAKRRA